ncbi:MAG: tryptophan synthase subunit alpha [Burkholderiaceae bacterium]|jgi:tryptophan synthase alpha chain|nr:tryptophan synthase subunit alpha [Burkholderiaceae bacterium]MDP4970162.1 tryptophan synthase subunit alpha [Burkholderiaceae bacterium]MDP5112262.1 tryptophan synthase subunit alpha [Burkholderiaceae bacterium]
MAQHTDRIAAAFARAAQQKRAALIPYIAAGNPLPETTVPLMHALVKAGADVIELGIPFSDPMADGPVIQRAAEHAIAQGIGLKHVLVMVAEFRKQDQATPIVLMGYANPIENMGQQAFAEQAEKVGVDGLLTVDYPPEEIDDFVGLLNQHHIAPIFLLAPTSTETRIRAVGKIARGYVYYVSLNGVTGAGHLDTADVAMRLKSIRQHVALPVGVGFGISDAKSAQSISLVADAVVIGSKLIDTMTKAAAGLPMAQQSQAAIDAGAGWLAGIRQALDVARSAEHAT